MRLRPQFFFLGQYGIYISIYISIQPKRGTCQAVLQSWEDL